MATRVIEEPSSTHVVHEHYDSDNGNAGVVVAAIVILLFAILFIFYGLPLIRNIASPQVNVPSQYDVNVHTSK